MQLPPDVMAYKRTAVFDQDTIPAGLRRNHRTAPGVWGVIRLLEGHLVYRTVEPPSETVLAPDFPAVIAPQEYHEVALCGPVRFFIEFYSSPGNPPQTGSGQDG